ncbi:hypothetical protein AZJ81_11220, partial [Streptococcus pneumoniae]
YKQPKYFSSRGLIKPIVSSVGHLDNLEYKEDIAIYNLSIDDNEEIIQNSTDTRIKIRKE